MEHGSEKMPSQEFIFLYSSPSREKGILISLHVKADDDSSRHIFLFLFQLLISVGTRRVNRNTRNEALRQLN